MRGAGRGKGVGGGEYGGQGGVGGRGEGEGGGGGGGAGIEPTTSSACNQTNAKPSQLRLTGARQEPVERQLPVIHGAREQAHH